MIILDGKKVAHETCDSLKREIDFVISSRGYYPHLSVILVGNDPASHTYVDLKRKKCQELGIQCTVNFFKKIDSEQLKREIIRLNDDKFIDGIIVQLPLIGIDDSQKILDSILPNKDVDGFSSVNYGIMARGGNSYHIPATPQGILMLLDYYKITLSGKHCVIIGRGKTVGAPLSILLSLDNRLGNATVTLCHSKTENLKALTTQADILIVAAGKAEFIDIDYIKEGAIVVDVGINRISDNIQKRGYRIVGDVNFSSISKKASYATPVPGGIGPMTIASLLQNTVRASLFNI